MDYAILASVVGIILICGFIGRSKGLVKIVLTIVATVVSVFVSSFMTTPMCEFIKERFQVMDKIKEVVEESLKDVKIEDTSYIEKLELPDVIKDKIIEGAQGIDVPVKDYVVESVASVALSAIVFIAIFVIATIVLGVVISVADVIAKLPLIAQANRGAGFVAGVAYGVILVWIAMIILTAMSSTSWAGDILLTIGDNKILSLIYDSNPIINILTDIISKLY